MTDSLASIRLCAELGLEWRDRLEELLFFNPQQALLEQRILESIRMFGLPKVVSGGRSLRVVVGESQPVGTLYALIKHNHGEALAGVLLFLRRQAELTCLHLSIAEAYTARGARGSLRVAAHLLDGLHGIGTRIAGVEHMAIFYKQKGWHTLSIHTRLL